MLAKHPKIADPLFMCKNDSDDFPVNDGCPTETPILFIDGKRRRSPETAIDLVNNVLHYRLKESRSCTLGCRMITAIILSQYIRWVGQINISPLAVRRKLLVSC